MARPMPALEQLDRGQFLKYAVLIYVFVKYLLSLRQFGVQLAGRRGTTTMTNYNLTLRAAIDEVVNDLDNIRSATDQALAFLGEIRDPQDYDEPSPAAAALSLAWGDAATI